MSLEDLKQKIKEEIPISSVIGQYLSIKRSGTSQVSLCPFHGDTRPSMNINDSKKIFKCFSCGASGDAIGFVMKYKNLDFIEAMKEICKGHGINFEAFEEEKKKNPKIEMAKKILTRAGLIYRKLALSGQFNAYFEFLKKRQLSEETAANYQLGFAANQNSIGDYLSSIPDQKDRDLAMQVAFEIGIIKKDRHNPDAYYDTFRDRIMFPIWDQFGQIIGFTSRAIRADQKAKYLNSIESYIFHKGQILYGFHLAKASIREKDSIILVEGNMDQIALYSFGFKNAVAIMGIGTGTQAMDRILSYTKNIFLALDSDAAGIAAAERLNREFAERGIIAKFLEFSPEKDPDEFLLAHGGLALQKKLDEAQSFFDYALSKSFPDSVPEVLDRKLELLQDAFKLLAPLKMNLSATERLVAFAKKLGLKSENAQIIQYYQDYLNQNPVKKTPLQTQPSAHSKEYGSKTILSEEENEKEDGIKSELELNEKSIATLQKSVPIQNELENIPLTKAERLLVQELVQFPSLFHVENFNEILDLVDNSLVKKYFDKVRRITLEIDDSEYEAIILNLTHSQEYPVELKEAVTSAFFHYKPREVGQKTKYKIIFDLKNKLLAEKLKKKKEEIKKRQQLCTTEFELSQVLQELTLVEKEIAKLKTLKHTHHMKESLL